MCRLKFLILLLVLMIPFLSELAIPQQRENAERLAEIREALTFYASFDRGFAADFAAGDSSLYVAPAWEDRENTRAPYSAADQLQIHKEEGVVGGALWIKNGDRPVYFYRGEDNIHYSFNDWEGTVSFWLRLSPDEDLAEGYSDPIQLTDSAWNDGALYVDFTYEVPRIFRFAFFAERDVWDPKLRDWEEIPEEERPMVEVDEPVFSRGKWTYIAFSFRNFNTGEANGTVDCYINGEFYGQLADREQTLKWEPEKTAIWLGYNYTGYMDELSIYNKALSAEQIRRIYLLENGVTELLEH